MMTMTSDEFATITLTMPSGESYEVHASSDDALVAAIENIGEKTPADGTSRHYMYLRTESDGTVLPTLHLGDYVEMNSDDPICSPWNGCVGRLAVIDHTVTYPYTVVLSDDITRCVSRDEIVKVSTVAL